MKTKPRMCVWIVAVLMLASAAVRSEELPLAAQTAMARGKVAFRQKLHGRAAGYFAEALDAAPRSPEVLLHFAVANEQLKGKELLTIAAYQAYLAAAPQAKNAPHVRKLIIQLEVAVEAQVLELVELANAARIGFLKKTKIGVQSGYTMQEIGIGKALAGDYKAAKPWWVARHPKDLVALQAATGDISGAKATAQLYRGWKDRVLIRDLYVEIAEAQARAGDVDGARMTHPEFQRRSYNSLGQSEALRKLEKLAREGRVVDPVAAWLRLLKDRRLSEPWVVDREGHLQSLKGKSFYDMFRGIEKAYMGIGGPLHDMKALAYRTRNRSGAEGNSARPAGRRP